MSAAKIRYILISIAAVLVLSVFTVLAIKHHRTPPVVSSVAVSNQQSDSGNATARALAVGTANRLLDQAKAEPDTTKQEAIRKQALTKIQPFLIDPNQNDIAVWRVAGKIALADNNDNLAAFAFEAIARLQPDYAKDDSLLDLMTDLNTRPIAEKVKSIPSKRNELVGWINSSHTGNAANASTMWLIGYSYDNGSGVPMNDSEAVKWYRKAADEGDAEAMFNLGYMYANGEGVAQDYGDAVKWYRKAADEGVAEAIFNLGVSYDNGQGVAQDDSEAVKWYRKAAQAGYADAMFNLGLMYANGEGVEQDDSEAVKWFRKAADEGVAEAMYNLGVMYGNGEGVRKDYSEAVKWYRKAAMGGNAKAMSNLGVMYANGEGVRQDYGEAMKWYRKAADEEYAGAMFNLGVMYYNGEGVAQDDSEAVKWFRKAARKGYKPAQDALRKLGKSW